jgi:hypothetical protein
VAVTVLNKMKLFNAIILCTCLLKFLKLSTGNVYRYLWRHYGIDTTKLFGELVKARIQMCKLNHDISFIRTCKTENLVPVFLRFRVAIPRLANSKLIRQCRDNILEDELKFKREVLRQTVRHIARLKMELQQAVPRLIFIRLASISQEIVNKKSWAFENTHKTKLDGLRAKNLYYVPPQQTLDPVTNLSKYKLTEDEHAALINGLNHVYPTEKFHQPQFVCNMEFFYARLLNLKTNYRHYESKPADVSVRHQLTSTQLSAASELREAANLFKKEAQSELKRVGTDYRKTSSAIRSLAKNKDIVIARPDKGRGVVIMDRSDYVQKMNVILNDSSTFTPIEYDPTLENETHLTTTLRLFLQEGFITRNEYDMARPVGSRPARIYGVPKLHKDKLDPPLRPVMSATKTVSYGLGKMLKNRLNHLRISPYTVKNTFDFVKKIRASKNMNKTMVSFDVTSLFTNVPLTYTINLILDKMYPTCLSVCNNELRSQLCEKCRKRRDFETLLRVATSETHFTFDNKMYIQHNGVAMGAPLAPIIADIFMSHLEETLMDRLVQSGVCEWYRYVDDTFILMEPDTNVDGVLNILNNFHPSIQFTCQPETGNSLPFLDVLVTRSIDSKKFHTTVYRKPTFTGLMIKWDSFVPMQYKKSSIVSLVQRALYVCSNYSLLSDEFDNIREFGQKNGYPLSFINTRIGIGLNNYLKVQNTINETALGCEKQRMYVEIPYTGGTTSLLKKKLSRISEKLRPDLDVHFFARPPPSVQHFFNTKDIVPKHLQSDVVYSVKCNDCGDLYVGKTQRQGARRMWEHGAPKTTFEEEKVLSMDYAHNTNQQNNESGDEEDANNIKLPTGPLRRKKRKTAPPYPDLNALRRSARIRAGKVISRTTNTQTKDQTGKKVEKPENSNNIKSNSLTSVSRHAQQTGHQMDWKGFNVVCKDNHYYKLLVKESLVIKAYDTQLNKTTHSVPLVIFPEGLPKHLLPDPNGHHQQ